LTRGTAVAVMAAMSTLALGSAVTAQDADDELSIAYVSPVQDITDGPGQSLVAMREDLAAAGIEYQEFAAAPPVHDDVVAYDRILGDLVTLAPDYAIVFPATSWAELFPRLEEITAAGTELIGMNVAGVTPDEYPFEALTYVTVPENVMGMMAGQKVAEEACAQGRDPVNLAIFHGPPSSEIGLQRTGNFLTSLASGLEGCGITLNIPQQVYTNFNRELAFTTAERVISANPEINVIMAANSNTGMGVLTALQGLGVDASADGVWIVGQGGQLDELAAVCRGEIFTAPSRNPRDLGASAAAAIVADLNDEEVPDVVATELRPASDCDEVFQAVPFSILETDAFRTLIPEEQWDEMAAKYGE
jgi:ABC-type sugar transport system substrate-binding protein